MSDRNPNDIAETAGRELAVEAKLRPALLEWLADLRTSVSKDAKPGRLERIGRITYIADGIARVSGLDAARVNEMLAFPGGVYGMAANLDADEIGCVMLGDDSDLNAGDPVRLTNRVLSVPVGKGLLGRVVDALGRPLDGEGSVEAERRDPIEKEAPAILDRAPVETQLVTGIKVIDALIPIGRGQRELIVGDRATGKTSIAVDTILSQRDTDVISLYVAIGQKASTVKRVTESLRRHNCLDRMIVVSADADDPPGLLYIAPYAATTMAEYFMEQGRDVLVIYDDLTRHARAHRELSLLLRRPPGREAFPGDVFFIHSRLLERATRLKAELGGGSLTAIPIVETQAKNMSAYIPTNLISITDGQIFLDPDLFYKGVKPPVDAGKSVSRVGGKTQLPAIRAAAKKLRLEYAQFAELEIFTRFGATVEKETRRKIERGRRIRETLKQGRLSPLSAGKQVLTLLSVDRGMIDDVALEKVRAFEEALHGRVAPAHKELMGKVASGEDLSEEEWDALAEAIQDVAGEFADATPDAPPDGRNKDITDDAEPGADRETDSDG